MKEVRHIRLKRGQIAIERESGEAEAGLGIQRKGQAWQAVDGRVLVMRIFAISGRDDQGFDAAFGQVIQQQTSHLDDAIDLGQEGLGDNRDPHEALQ